MSKKHQYILRKNGIDADRYLSMRIDKESIPDGAEVVIQIKDKDTGELRTVPVSTAFDGYFGKNSRFYMQVMNDGHVLRCGSWVRSAPSWSCFSAAIRKPSGNAASSLPCAISRTSCGITASWS